MYTTSLSVASIAGYVLGFGNRYMCSMIINNRTAKLVRIDFSDCFNTAVNREIYPEKFLFRQTRVMINALEGTRRSCIEMSSEKSGC
jgi:FKBP12-rapamycin complex-associated protein